MLKVDDVFMVQPPLVRGSDPIASGPWTMWHFTKEEYEQMLADPACKQDVFKAHVLDTAEDKRVAPELIYHIEETQLKTAGLGHWIEVSQESE